ncbi:Protein argonaute-2 [Hypsibius exemplaris]|uniref:Protein argonaute-2 n=1 Tax=Hypsibius exemplaris TaxID=2072580 RepID=A0A1W0WPR0_HYPEX|nr:Protein argonaute-2 [Hypsibius exemplaris]
MALVSKNRPGWGTLGRPIKIYANHFIIEVPKQGSFYHYDVEMEILRDKSEPEGDVDGKKAAKTPAPSGKPDLKLKRGAERTPGRISKELKRKAMRAFLDANPGGFLNGNRPVFDGEKNLYAMKTFKIADGDSKSAEIVIPRDADGSETRVRVTVKPCKPLTTSWSALHDVIDKKTKEVPIEVFQCINTVFREAALATGNKIAAGRSFFWRDNSAMSLGGGREAWPGFYSSARPCQWKITLNLDVANTAFYEKQHVLDFLCKVLNTRQCPTQLNDTQRRLFEKELRTLKVEVKHSGGLRRVRVAAVSKNSAKTQKFEQDGKQITVADYFKKQYKIVLKYPDLPLVEVGTKKNFLPMEICEVAAGQKVMKKLTEEQTAIMVKNCAKPAPERQARVQKIRDEIMNYDTSGALKEFGITVDKRMKMIDNARVLPMPVMGMGHATKNDAKGIAPEVQEISVKTMDGTWTSAGRYFDPKNLDNWVVIDLDQDRRLPLDFFLDEFIATGKQRGMRIAQPQLDGSIDPRDITTAIKNIQMSYKKQNKTVDLIMIIMRVRGPAYADIKKAGDVLYGVPTQVVLGKNIARSAEKGKGPMNQLASNILLKVNAKLGGAHSKVMDLGKNKTLFGSFTDKPTIVFGADVTHPSPGEGMNKPSIAAVVASYNVFFTKYSARVRAQGHREEMMTTLKDMVVELMVEFKVKCGGREPQRIIFYRDGVSEGQYQQVMLDELRAIQAACITLCPGQDYKPPITYIIVGKRHHTRLFTADPRDAVGKAGNVPPGTITDRAICHFSEFDWFLCSHYGIQGTSRPAHYNVLYDDSNYQADQIQMFSYYLTYCYARCARSVSIPAPAYYAHLAAFRARHHMEEAGDTQSTNSSGDSGPNVVEINKKIKVHDDMHSKMYFA